MCVRDASLMPHSLIVHSSYLLFFLQTLHPPKSTLLSLHDALPISRSRPRGPCRPRGCWRRRGRWRPRCHDCRSEEHTSELQSRPHLVCRLLLEKKKKNEAFVLMPPRRPISL